MEIKVTIEATALVEAINNLASALSGVKVATPDTVKTEVVQAQPPAAAPTPQTTAPAPQQAGLPAPGIPLAQPPKYTAEQIMAAGATLMDAGKANDLIELLKSFGVNAVTELKPEQYGAFATKMREMGAKI